MNLPPYKSFPKLISERLILREIRSSEIQDIFEISYFDAVKASTIEEAEEMQEKIYREYVNGKTINWGMADKNSDKIIGTCGFHSGFPDGQGELGCVLKTEFQGKGFMTEALKAVIQFGLKEMGLKRIIAVTTSPNLNAVKLLERIGFEKTSDLEEDLIEYQFIQ